MQIVAVKGPSLSKVSRQPMSASHDLSEPLPVGAVLLLIARAAPARLTHRHRGGSGATDDGRHLPRLVSSFRQKVPGGALTKPVQEMRGPQRFSAVLLSVDRAVDEHRGGESSAET